MGKQETAVKFAKDVLTSKAKFKRFVIIFAMLLLTAGTVIAYGFKTGAISWSNQAEQRK